MSGKLTPDYRQKERLAGLVDELGVKVYREVKAALGLGRMRPFQRFSYAEAMRLIGMLESLKGEQVFDARSHQHHPLQPQPIGILEPIPMAEGKE